VRPAICEQFGIDFPLFAFSHCRDVVAAVTNAGGFGVLGATAFPPQLLDQELSWIDDHVGGKSYGLDLIVPAKFVGKGEKLVHCAAPPLRNLHVETAREMQSADLLLPNKIKPVVAPAAGYLDDQLLVAGAVMRPIVGDDDLFDKIDGVTGKRGGFDN